MGYSDYRDCDVCGEQFDKEDMQYCSTEGCYRLVCNFCVAEQNNIKIPSGTQIEDIEVENYMTVTCHKCAEDDEEDGDLLQHALELLNLNRQELIMSYRTAKKLTS